MPESQWIQLGHANTQHRCNHTVIKTCLGYKWGFFLTFPNPVFCCRILSETCCCCSVLMSISVILSQSGAVRSPGPPTNENKIWPADLHRIGSKSKGQTAWTCSGKNTNSYCQDRLRFMLITTHKEEHARWEKKSELTRRMFLAHTCRIACDYSIFQILLMEWKFRQSWWKLLQSLILATPASFY